MSTVSGPTPTPVPPQLAGTTGTTGQAKDFSAKLPPKMPSSSQPTAEKSSPIHVKELPPIQLGETDVNSKENTAINENTQLLPKGTKKSDKPQTLKIGFAKFRLKETPKGTFIEYRVRDSTLKGFWFMLPHIALFSKLRGYHTFEDKPLTKEGIQKFNDLANTPNLESQIKGEDSTDKTLNFRKLLQSFYQTHK